MSKTGDELYQEFEIAYDSTAQDNDQAMSFLRQSAEKGHAEAQYKLGLAHFANMKFDSAKEWLDKSLEQPHDNHEEAQEYLNTIEAL